MTDFKKQIEEDIRSYQEKYGDVLDNINTDDWAFNFWVLDKFFYEDEELIVDKITEYSDFGIDAYEWYEDTKELYLIQNKFYSEDTPLPSKYVQNTFLVTPLSILENGVYTRSKELQNIYQKHKDDEGFTVHLQLYITNNLRNQTDIDSIKKFNMDNSPRIFAEIYYLDDIEAKWYGEPRKTTKTFSAEIESVNNGTILNINNEAYHLDNIVDAKYIFTPVSCIYRMVLLAEEKGYPLFEKNIREYLGNKGINKRIYQTLKSDEERKNFFYYNNGITIICSKMGTPKTIVPKKGSNIGLLFSIDNPQIVNGCQTVNSIFSALKEYGEEDVEAIFKDTFVMVKVLQIDTTDSEQQQLAKKIVTYNNSQNSLDEKQFVANNELFQRIKSEFAEKGFLLMTKQSDAATYSAKYTKKSDLTKLQMLSITRRQLFGLETLKKVTDFEIPLEKFLQVILAFKVGGLAAYTMKKDVLKPETQTYNTVVEFIRSSNATTDVLLNLYLLYLRFEKEKKAQSDKFDIATPIPFYAIDGFSRYECGRDVKKIAEIITTPKEIGKIMRVYTLACNNYADQYMRQQNTDYTKMIKAAVDYDLFHSCHMSAVQMYEMMSSF